ncbi:hypothetical protein KFE25_003728 [Diacronema lutheri]|uniref:Uncharacterized protein n=1 Tax=Diacronema lutheri TaxID=2081491 RepID=A0A8J5X4I2_DIALT|nr:hypothetical protein KFE25_003728 [Diacronema lutheri]
MASASNGTDKATALLRAPPPAETAAKKRRLLLTFGGLLFAGLGNKLCIKLATLPMYNYPLFLNAFSSFTYVPTSFAYIIPMAAAGRFTQRELQIPQLVFATIGALDALAGLMQLLATTFIPSGSLLILLQQSSIPISMLLSRLVLRADYTRAQVAGAAVVIAGIAVILLPSLCVGDSAHDAAGGSSGGIALWSAVLVCSCVPMCLSTVYKERALAAVDCDPVFLNGWVALWQFAISLPLSVPAAPLSGVAMRDVPSNLLDGWRCFVGVDTVGATEAARTGRHIDACWPGSLVYTGLYLGFNQAFNILIVLMLKFGSANLLYLAMTLLVPLGNIAFALPFVPGSMPPTRTNFAGLAVIMAGLFIYRFADRLLARRAVLAGRAPRTADEPPEQRMATQARRARAVMSSPSGIFAIESFQSILDADLILARDADADDGDGDDGDEGARGGGGEPRAAGAVPTSLSSVQLLRLDLGLHGVNPLEQSLLRSDSAALLFRY